LVDEQGLIIIKEFVKQKRDLEKIKRFNKQGI
jgi:hypothetical protein